MATPIGDGIEKMLFSASTRPIPASLQRRLEFLLHAEGDSVRAVASRIGVDPGTVRRWRSGKIRQPTPEHTAAVEREVRRSWQPRVRQRAIRQAIQAGITVDTKAQFGFTAAPGTTDDARERLITQLMPPEYTARLLDAYRAGEDEEELQKIVADSLRYTYFQDYGRRAHDLSKVTFSDIDYADFEI